MSPISVPLTTKNTSTAREAFSTMPLHHSRIVSSRTASDE
jgi:hypothetical protein